MGRWSGLLEWPSWLLATVYLICTLVIMLVAQVVHLLIIKPTAEALISSASRAARALVATLTAKRHYVLKAETGHYRVITGTGHIQAGPATLSGTGTVTNPRRLSVARSLPLPY
jgi:hypothetical protein